MKKKLTPKQLEKIDYELCNHIVGAEDIEEILSRVDSLDLRYLSNKESARYRKAINNLFNSVYDLQELFEGLQEEIDKQLYPESEGGR